MSKQECVLGIDTSNYTTSVALTNQEDGIILDRRIPLVVKQGERGLRQSTALFQHLENLPALLKDVLAEHRDHIKAVCVSEKPRPAEGSYMPVFKGGTHFGETVAAALSVPLFKTTHQEGHLRAGAWNTSLDLNKPYMAWHLSGGTCELLLCREGDISIIGGTKDISFGQLIDRIGVALGHPFPCGKVMDDLALQGKVGGLPVKPIAIDNLHFNVSGIESQLLRSLPAQSAQETAFLIFEHIAICLLKVSVEASRQMAVSHILFTGGVSASCYLRQRLTPTLEEKGVNAHFGLPGLSSDNACGTALLGGDMLWP